MLLTAFGFALHIQEVFSLWLSRNAPSLVRVPGLYRAEEVLPPSQISSPPLLPPLSPPKSQKHTKKGLLNSSRDLRKGGEGAWSKDPTRGGGGDERWEEKCPQTTHVYVYLCVSQIPPLSKTPGSHLDVLMICMYSRISWSLSCRHDR